MAIISRSSSTFGKWLDKKALVTGDKIKIVSEATEQPSTLNDSMQLVAKVVVKDKVKEPENVAINMQSKNALIDAYGTDTSAWINKVVTATMENTTVGGKRVRVLYMIPEGMVLKEGTDGFLHIGREEAEQPAAKELPVVEYPEEDINPADIPF